MFTVSQRVKAWIRNAANERSWMPRGERGPAQALAEVEELTAGGDCIGAFTMSSGEEGIAEAYQD
jgi:hypothetical protein